MLATGQTLSFYEVLGPLGAGAMGEVYLARDTRLGREVALKVLPDELARGGETLQRFEREARTLASLNHPNVAQVFGIDRVDETCFMAMEFVPGEDLARRLSRGALDVDEALDVCRQIAEGVEAAHEAGVVHRDLKPANVVLAPDGRVKVLDFGLAKSEAPRSAADATSEVFSTAQGRVLGTPTYMAPEQARGKPIDRRVDVWAFGCVLYECLTAHCAFGAETVTDVLAAVLDKNPEWSRLPNRTPRHVRRLLERCLDKNPRTRLQDMGEARIALCAGPFDDGLAVNGAGRTTWRPIAAAISIASFAAVGGLLALRPTPTPASPLDGATFHRLTDPSGTEFDADISPHGDFVAYGSDRDGTLDLWVAQVDGGEPKNLTQGGFNLHDDAIRNLGFGAGGSHVWVMGGKGERLMTAPKVGGAFEPLMGSDVANADWTRDGARVVYQTDEPGDPIRVIDVNGPASDPVWVDRPGIHLHFPTWSFDERWIFLVRGQVSTGDMSLWRMRPDGSEREQLTHGLLSVAFPTPVDENTVLFVALDALGAGPWLWSLDLSSRSSRRASVGLERYTSVAASEDGRRVVAIVANPQAALWRVPIRAELAHEEDAGLLPGVPTLRASSPQYGGGELFYQSSRGAGEGLWMLKDGREREIWPGAREPLIFPPAISPDGSRAALLRRRGSRMVPCIVDVESREILREIDGPIDVRGTPSWSPSGDRILVGGFGPDGPGLFLLAIDGSSVERIVEGFARDPVRSPTEDLIVYCGEQVGPMLRLRGIRGDGTPVPLADLRVRQGAERVRFLPDGSGLVYMEGPRNAPDFRLLHLATGQTRQLTELDELGTIGGFDLTPDGRTIVFDRLRQNADVVLIERR